jgi:hypothetical protein
MVTGTTARTYEEMVDALAEEEGFPGPSPGPRCRCCWWCS